MKLSKQRPQIQKSEQIKKNLKILLLIDSFAWELDFDCWSAQSVTYIKYNKSPTGPSLSKGLTAIPM